MKRWSTLFFIVLLVLAVVACGTDSKSSSSSNEDADPKTANEKVDAFFAKFATNATPGGAVIILQHGKVLYQAAYGLANIEDMTPLTIDHVFHIGSTGKQITALAIMMLAEEGKLHIDDPVGNYVSSVVQFGRNFTIRHLLNHTSGMPDYDADMEDAIFAISSQPTNEDLNTVLSQMSELPTQPGEHFEYSNVGYDLLALVVERVSGQKFPDFLQNNVFDRLGMNHTFSLPNEHRRADSMIAMSYTAENGDPQPYPRDDLDNLYGSGSIYSTLGDMALYDEMLYYDPLVSQTALQEAFTPTTLNDGRIQPYGFGWEIEQRKGETYVAHSGAWLGFNTDYIRFPLRHFSVVVLLNRDYGYPDEPRIALQIAEIYLSND